MNKRRRRAELQRRGKYKTMVGLQKIGDVFSDEEEML